VVQPQSSEDRGLKFKGEGVFFCFYVLKVQGDFIVGWWLVVSGEEVADGR
jgi:hypothetical protein